MSARKLPVLPVLATFPESGDLLYVVDISDTSESPQGTSKQMERETLLDAGTFTLTPDVTAGTGTVNNFNFDYIKVGGKVLLTFLCRQYQVEVGEGGTDVQLDLTGTPAEPAANFATSGGYKGSISIGIYNDANSNIVSVIATTTVSGTKKIQISLNIESNVTGSPFDTSIGGAITITI